MDKISIYLEQKYWKHTVAEEQECTIIGFRLAVLEAKSGKIAQNNGFLIRP
ncbi:hypothetical protein CFS9_02230 [Flavobacterium sp. CFS9]|uniref:Uncharacterized protein n=1 Tax=Flavobacterium sp. CFS9 TaxID=3143118 RepID=A0AAT9GWK8_9FLAO